MYTWIIYDISEDKVRDYVAKQCKRLGLLRVQKSVFLGIASRTKLKAFERDIQGKINYHTDKLFIVPITKTRFKKVIQLGKKFDPKIIDNSDQVLFF